MTELASTIEAAYRARAGEFLRVATAIAGSREGGRDAVQEALTRAFARRGTFRGSGTLEAWLWKAVVKLRPQRKGSFPARRRRPSNRHGRSRRRR